MEPTRRERRSIAATSWAELAITPAIWGTWGTVAATTRYCHPNRRGLDDEDGYYDGTFYHQPEIKEFRGLVPLLFKVIQICFGLTAWIVVSAFSYSMFYQWMMPRQAVMQSFSLDYTSDFSRTSTTSDVSLPQWKSSFSSQERMVSTDECTATRTPFAMIDLFARHNAWTAFISDVEPLPNTANRLLNPGQGYYVELSLDLPESLANQQAGIFGIIVELYSSRNKTMLAAARISTRLPHESSWVGVIRKISILPALVVGALEESRTVYVSPFRHFTESKEHPLQFVSIFISGRDAEVEINKSVIRIVEELNKFQEHLKEWHYSCFMAGTLSFILFYGILWKVFLIMKECLFRVAFQMQEPPCDLDLDDQDFVDASSDYQHHQPGPVQPNGTDDDEDLGSQHDLPRSWPPMDDSDRFSEDSWEDIGNGNAPSSS